MDASEPVTAQDLHVINMILEARKGIVIAVNKSDLLTAEEREGVLGMLRRKCAFLPWAPVHFISAKNKKNIFNLIDSAIEISKTRRTQIATPKLNAFIQKSILKNTPPATGIFKTKFYYANQISVNPPKFIFFIKNAKHLHFSYKRYLENEMRKEFGFEGTPISIDFRENPVKEKGSGSR
jgi:GTP-binding protein